MVYYMRHTELLEDVYKDLTDRYNNEITAMGGSAKEEESLLIFPPSAIRLMYGISLHRWCSYL